MSVPRTRIGHFEASGQLPDIPFFLKGSYTLQVIARNAEGEQAERDIPGHRPLKRSKPSR